MNISLSTGNTAPKPRFSTEGAITSPTYLTWLQIPEAGGAESNRKEELSRLRPQSSAFLIGPVSSRLVTSHACAPRVKGGRGSPRRRQDGGARGTTVPKTAARGHAVAEQVWCLGRLPRGRGWPGPKGRKESFLYRGLTLRRARLKTATHLHLELGSRYDCRRVGRSGFS